MRESFTSFYDCWQQQTLSKVLQDSYIKIMYIFVK